MNIEGLNTNSQKSINTINDNSDLIEKALKTANDILSERDLKIDGVNLIAKEKSDVVAADKVKVCVEWNEWNICISYEWE